MNILIRLIKKIKYKLKNEWRGTAITLFPLTPELPFPKGVSEDELREYLKSVLVADAPPQEMANYCDQDFRRFVYTYGLVRDVSGKCLELGANPYFTTLLLKEFTQLELVLANYFGSHITDKIRHNREYNKHELQLLLNYMGFTIESMFTADVHENHANHYCSIAQLESLLKHRELDLGQYIFVRASNQKKARTKKPAFLYRSYPEDQLE